MADILTLFNFRTEYFHIKYIGTVFNNALNNATHNMCLLINTIVIAKFINEKIRNSVYDFIRIRVAGLLLGAVRKVIIGATSA